MYLVVAYDIPDDRRRARLARFLLKYMDRVQKSVFEGEVREVRLEGLRQGILRVIAPEEDSVRIYHLCERCVAATEVLGLTQGLGADDDVLV